MKIHFAMRKAVLIILLLSSTLAAFAQRITDRLDRGLVAVPASSGSGNLVSWRIFAEEYYDVTYNLYCNGSKIASNLSVSNFQHTAGNSSSSYQVAAVVRGVEQEKCAAITRWENGFLEIPVKGIVGRDGADVTSNYTLNDVSMGDLDGDGVVEFIVKRPCSLASDISNKNCFHVLDCYHRDGTRLWWIDLGPNMLSGADEQWDAVCFDWDQDGKAEVLLRIQDNAIIHYADGTADTIGSTSVDTRWSGIEYTSSGNEYLLYLEGATGKPYEIGDSSHPKYMTYPIARGSDSDWGSGIVGHRSTKHYFAAPYLDGRHASIFLGRGCYTKHIMKTFDVDPTTHKLTPLWTWQCSVSGPWFGQGYHNFQVADVDWDGRDEIVFGSMVIDDNGKGLSTTGLGHGDSQHCSDFDPYRKYQEQFACNESSPANNYRNACTSQIYYRQTSSGDDGRALMGNFTNQYPGSVGRSVASSWISSTSDKVISELGDIISWGDLNSRIYYDGDLLDEYLESPGTEGYGVVYKAGGGRVANLVKDAYDTKMNNYTKNNPAAQGDIFGDWREEVVLRKSDNTALRVFTTGYLTEYRIPTLWHDHQYRNAMVWQSMGYNQCPHKSYFLGELEGITYAPAPLTMTGRTEITNGGTIKTTDDHVIVCENADTEISIADGASPYIVTFNVPSWVQGNAGSNTTAKPDPTYTYYTCNVTGGALTGNTRLVKQGDGILNLPKVDMKHSGNTDIWAGTVNFDGTMHNSNLWLNRFSEFNGDAAFHSIKADYGSVIRPGGKGAVGTITADSTLYLGFGSRVVLDIDGNQSDCIVCKTLVIETKNWSYGPEYLMPVIEISGDNIMAGTYLIGQVDSISGSLVDLKFEGTGSFKRALKYQDGKIYLTLGDVRGSSRVTWYGNESDVWDYATTENFFLSSDKTKAPEMFVSGDIVEFTDSALVKSVTIKDEVTVDTFLVNSTQNYTFTGAGKIVSGAFVKEGSGKVTLSTDNTFTGGSYLRGGTVVVKALANSTQAYGGLGSVVTASKKFTMENGAVLQNTAEVQNGSLITCVGTDGGVLFTNAAFTQQKAVLGTLLTKKGGGTLTFSANNTSLKKLCVVGGTVAVASTPAAAVVMQGGTLSFSDGSSCPIEIADGKTSYINYYANRGTYTNKLTGGGTVTIWYPVVNGGSWYATRTSLAGDWSAFTGTLKPNALAADGRFCLNNSYGMAKGTMEIPSGITVVNTGKTFAIGRLTGTGNLGDFCGLSNGSSGTATWNVGNDSAFVFEGDVTGTPIFNKVGKSTMTVTNAWSTKGAVSVKAGTVLLKKSASVAPGLGTGSLNVASGAFLMGDDTSIQNASVSVSGTLYPGTSIGTYRGALIFNGQNVTITSSGKLRVCLRRAGTSATVLGASGLKKIKTLTINGTIHVDINNNLTVNVGDEFRIWANVESFSGTPTITCSDSSITFSTEKLSEGLLVVTSVGGTGIDRTVVDAESEDVYYSITGQPMGQDVDELPSGIYICNGRKFIKK